MKKYSIDPQETKARIYDGRYCVNQKKKFGKECSYNCDCDSNRCVSTDNKEDKLERKCLIYENAPEIPSRNFGNITDDDLPEGDPKRSAAWKQIKNKPIFLNEKSKEERIRWNGPDSRNNCFSYGNSCFSFKNLRKTCYGLAFYI